MKPGERARVCPSCGKIVNGRKFGHDSACRNSQDPGGRVRSLGPMGRDSRTAVYGSPTAEYGE